jgi:hypothetical protein
MRGSPTSFGNPMAREPTKRPRLADRDYEIFEHVMRHRITVREALHRLFFEGSDPNAVTKVTSRLVRHQYLNRYELYAPRSYFVVGPEGAKLLGISVNKTESLGPRALAREYGILAYCCLGPVVRKRLMVREIRERDPEFLQGKLDSGHYYLDEDGETTRLGYIRVDQGGSPENVVRKCREDLDQRYRYPRLRKLIDEGRFLIALVTAREEKKQAIHEALRQHRWPIRFRIEVVSDLLHLITRFDSVL